jgi:Protein of unknown function (DUF429)
LVIHAEAMHSLGLDLSTDPRKAWWCEVAWPERGCGPVSIVDLGQAYDLGARDDASLARVLAERITAFAPHRERIVGIDAPLGWPQAFVDAIRAWSEDDQPRITKRTELRLRPTDRFVQEATGLTPMSVSTDRIGSTALLCAHVLSALAETQGLGVLDRARAEDGVAEVYPAAALRLWSTGDGRPLAWSGYKVDMAAREVLLRQLAEVVDVELEGEIAAQMIASDDALDALLCALVAGTIARGGTFSVDEPVRAGDLVPPSSRVADPLAALEARTDRAEALRRAAGAGAAREGWIHVPRRATLDEVAPPAHRTRDGSATTTGSTASNTSTTTTDAADAPTTPTGAAG